MCAWRIQKPERQTCLLTKVSIRRLRKVQERKIISVCLGIEHMIKRRKMASKGNPVDHDHHHRVCRLCQSTRRVLRIAWTLGSQKQVGYNREACRMWAMVKARCASLGLDMTAVIDESIPDDGVTAGAAGSSRQAVPFEGFRSSCK